MIIFLPWRLEFGTMLMHWVRYVQQQLQPVPEGVRSIVCCRRGDEPLFPGASEYCYDWEELPDVRKKWSTFKAGDHQEYLQALEQEMMRRHPGAKCIHPPRRFPKDMARYNFKPKPQSETVRLKAWPEILLAPRYREHGAHRNYKYWPTLIEAIQGSGLNVGLIGMKQTSIDSPIVSKKWKAWSYDDNLSITLQMMARAKLVVTTDSAMAHLAVLARAPLAVIYHNPGVEAGKEEWPWAFDHMKAHAENYCSPILGGWNNPNVVIDFVRVALGNLYSGKEDV